MLITTHLVRDMENIFDDVMFLKEGKIVLSGNVEKLREERAKILTRFIRKFFRLKEGNVNVTLYEV